MDGGEPHCSHFFNSKKVGKVGTGIVFAELAIAGGTYGGGIFVMFFFIGDIVGEMLGGVLVKDVEPFVAGIASRKHTIKNLVTETKTASNFIGLADSQTVKKIIFGGVVGDDFPDVIIEIAFGGDGPTAIAKSVKTDFNKFFGAEFS